MLSWEEHRRKVLELRKLEHEVAQLGRPSDAAEDESGEEPQPREWWGPYSHTMLEQAVTLKEQDASLDKIHEKIPALSKRQVGYIARAVDAGKLRSTRHGLEGVIRTDEHGVYIPKV